MWRPGRNVATRKPMITNAAVQVSAVFIESTEALLTPEAALPPRLRAEMEAAFGADFSAVRIHTDETAARLNKMLGAQAFTRGNDIFFNAGRFNPDTSAGKHLLAHELTHTRQQGK